jgi:hypothetical protein
VKVVPRDGFDPELTWADSPRRSPTQIVAAERERGRTLLFTCFES